MYISKGLSIFLKKVTMNIMEINIMVRYICMSVRYITKTWNVVLLILCLMWF